MGDKNLSDAFLVSVNTDVRASELRNIHTPYILESGLHIGITRNGHPSLIQLSKRSRAILDERAKSAKDKFVFPFKKNWYRNKWDKLKFILKFGNVV